MLSVVTFIVCGFLHAGSAGISWRQDTFTNRRNIKDNFGKIELKFALVSNQLNALAEGITCALCQGLDFQFCFRI